MKQPTEAEALIEKIGLALSSSHGTIATDLPETKEATTLIEQGKAWRIDHTQEIEALRKLKALLQKH